MKKEIGTSDAWSMSHLSQRPSKSAYYSEDCWIFGPVNKSCKATPKGATKYFSNSCGSNQMLFTTGNKQKENRKNSVHVVVQ